MKITIPENVLRCTEISRGAKLLYGDIAFICERDGCCEKRSSYFAELYGVSRITISKWISSLQKKGFIKCKIRHKYIRTIFLLSKNNRV